VEMGTALDSVGAIGSVREELLLGVAVLCGQPGEAAMERGWLSDLHSSWQI